MSKIFKCDYCGKEFTMEYYEGGYIDHENFCRNVSNRNAEDIIKMLEEEKGSSDCTVSVQQNKLDSFLKRKDVKQDVKDLVKKHFDEKYETLKNIFNEDLIEKFNFYVKDINKLLKFSKEMDLKNKEFQIVYLESYPKAYLSWVEKPNIAIVINGNGYLLLNK